MSLAALEAGIGARLAVRHLPRIHGRVDRAPLGINVAVMLGHTPVRLSVMGEEATERAARPDEIATMKRLDGRGDGRRRRRLRDLGVQGPCRLFRPAGAEPAGRLRRDAGNRRRRRQVGPRHHPVQCRPRSALGGVRGSSTQERAGRWSGRRCWRARSGPTRTARSSPRPASRSRAACRSTRRAPAGRSRSSSISTRPWCSTPGPRSPRRARRPTTTSRRAIYADPGLPRAREAQADGRGPDDAVFMGKELEGDTRRAAFGDLRHLLSRRITTPQGAHAGRCRQGARQACRRPDARPRAGQDLGIAHARQRCSTSSRPRCARSSRTPTS